jgi:hypothetical protein
MCLLLQRVHVDSACILAMGLSVVFCQGNLVGVAVHLDAQI